MLLVGLISVVFLLALFNVEQPERPEATATAGVLADPDGTYDPFRAGEPLPAGYRQVLPRDVITPVYDPTFLETGEVAWSGDTLVIGVAIGTEAKAYPVAHLNSREMVVDRIAGMPILVTW